MDRAVQQAFKHDASCVIMRRAFCTVHGTLLDAT